MIFLSEGTDLSVIQHTNQAFILLPMPFHPPLAQTHSISLSQPFAPGPDFTPANDALSRNGRSGLLWTVDGLAGRLWP